MAKVIHKLSHVSLWYFRGDCACALLFSLGGCFSLSLAIELFRRMSLSIPRKRLLASATDVSSSARIRRPVISHRLLIQPSARPVWWFAPFGCNLFLCFVEIPTMPCLATLPVFTQYQSALVTSLWVCDELMCFREYFSTRAPFVSCLCSILKPRASSFSLMFPLWRTLSWVRHVCNCEQGDSSKRSPAHQAPINGKSLCDDIFAHYSHLRTYSAVDDEFVGRY